VTKFRFDDVVGGCHRRVRTALSNGLSMKGLRSRWTDAHEELERGQDDTQIVELSKSWNEIGNEIYWR